MNDAQNYYSFAQAVTAAAVSTNVLNHRQAGRDIGVGEPLYIVSVVKTAFTDAGSDSSLDVNLQTDDDELFGSLTAVRTLFSFPALAAVGTVRIARIQPDDINEIYSRLQYAPQNGDLTTGAVESFITHDINRWKAFPDAIVIS